MISRKNTDLALASIATLLFLAIISDLATKGMTLDGSLYAAIARNLAAADGSFWFPASHIANQSFHDHPPLGLFLQSLLFSTLGDHFWVENFYSALTLILTIALMINIMRTTSDERSSWYGVLMFLITPLSAWAYTNNYLENTLTVFCLFGVALALHAISKNKALALQATSLSALSGIAIFLGLLTKGPVALWPLAVFPLYWVTFRPQFAYIAVLFFTQTMTIAIFVILTLGFTDGGAALELYWQNQIVSSLSGSRGSEFGRMLVITVLLKNLAGPIVYSTLLLLVLRTTPTLNRWSIFFLLLAFSASLPLMLSPRQYEHYLLPSLPVFVIAISFTMSGIADRFCAWSTQHTAKLAAIALALALTCIVVYQEKYASISDDKALLEFVEHVQQPLTEQTQIQYCRDFSNLRLQAYLFRYLKLKATDTNASFEVCDMPSLHHQHQPLVAHGALTLYRVD